MPLITCEFIATGQPVEKASMAERMANTRHRVTRCDKCEKYHVWVEVTYAEWYGAASAAAEARTIFYDVVGPNAYLHKGYRPNRNRKNKDKDGDDN